MRPSAKKSIPSSLLTTNSHPHHHAYSIHSSPDEYGATSFSSTSTSTSGSISEDLDGSSDSCCCSPTSSIHSNLSFNNDPPLLNLTMNTTTTTTTTTHLQSSPLAVHIHPSQTSNTNEDSSLHQITSPLLPKQSIPHSHQSPLHTSIHCPASSSSSSSPHFTHKYKPMSPSIQVSHHTPTALSSSLVSPTSMEKSTLFSWPFFRKRIKYYIPALHWIPNYSWKSFPHDLVAGITVACLLVPQSLSYASSLAHLNPVQGLNAACLPVFLYSFFGTSRQLALGPEAIVSILVGSVILNTTAKHSPQNEEENETLLLSATLIASTLSLLVGLFTFCLGFFRFGFIDSILSRTLLRGLILAIGVVILIEQAPMLLGLILPFTFSGSPIQKMNQLLKTISYTHFPSLLVSFSSSFFLGIMLYLKKKKSMHWSWLPYIPDVLVLVLFTTCCSYAFDWPSLGIPVLGPILTPSLPPFLTFPPLLPSFELLTQLTFPAILISIIGMVESLVIAKQFAIEKKYSISRNRELVALGLSNILGFSCSGFPVFGSLARSTLNAKVGAHTQLAGCITAGCIYFTLIWLLPYLQFLPKPVMATIISFSALHLFHVHELHSLIQLKAWKDLIHASFVFFITLFISVEAGTFVCIGVSLLFVVAHTTSPRYLILGQRCFHASPTLPLLTPVSSSSSSTSSALSPSPFSSHDRQFRSLKEHVYRLPGVLILAIEEPLHFANTAEFLERIQRLIKFGGLQKHPSEDQLVHEQIHHVILDMRHVPWMDPCALILFQEWVESMVPLHPTSSTTTGMNPDQEKGLSLSLVKVKKKVRQSMKRCGLDTYMQGRYFYSIEEALVHSTKEHAQPTLLQEEQEEGVISFSSSSSSSSHPICIENQFV